MPSRRTPPGVRELKLDLCQLENNEVLSRTPPGVRELKQLKLRYMQTSLWSHPSRGA